MTKEEIIQIWNSTPPQGDPTGKKFAVKFAESVIDAYCLEYELDNHSFEIFHSKS